MMLVSDERILELIGCMYNFSESCLKHENKKEAQNTRRNFRDIVSLLTEYTALRQEHERLEKENRELKKKLEELHPGKKPGI